MPEGIVRAFYAEMWDRAGATLVQQLFHPGFTFRGSLGPTLVGHDPFIGYVHFVIGTSDRCTSDIFALDEEGRQVFAVAAGHSPLPQFSPARGEAGKVGGFGQA